MDIILNENINLFNLKLYDNIINMRRIIKYICKICEKEYSSIQSLCNHTAKFHGITTRNKKTNTKITPAKQKLDSSADENKKYECDYCKLSYKFRQSKWRHVQNCPNKIIFNSIKDKIIENKVRKLVNPILELSEIPQDSKNNKLKKINKKRTENNIIIDKSNEVKNNIPTNNTITQNTLPETISSENDSSEKASQDITEINTIVTNNKKNKKHKIPKLLKNQSWDTYIGKEKGIGNCYCCSAEIDSKHFECGHVIPVSKGGPDTIDNLRPICSLCNKSMGTKNMDEFIKKYIKKSVNENL